MNRENEKGIVTIILQIALRLDKVLSEKNINIGFSERGVATSTKEELEELIETAEELLKELS